MLASILLANMRSELTGKLSEERKSHANWSDFRWKDFRDIEIHSGITEGSAYIFISVQSIDIQMTRRKLTPGRPDTGT